MSNNITVVGNLVEDPELRFTPSGTSMARLRLAVNRRWKDKLDEWQEEAHFFAATVWREQAENVAESLKKGDRVIVTGRLEQRSWETPEGDKRSVVEIAADEVAPSLRWATASVTKAGRQDSKGSNSYPDEAPF